MICFATVEYFETVQQFASQLQKKCYYSYASLKIKGEIHQFVEPPQVVNIGRWKAQLNPFAVKKGWNSPVRSQMGFVKELVKFIF